MSEKDLQQLRQVLREAVRASRRGVRELERSLGLGNGNLQRMLDGTLDLRVRHLIAFADLLGVPPADFLEAGCPDAAERAKHRLNDWIGRSERSAEPTAASVSLDQLKELIRGAVREEIAAQESEPERRRSRR